MPEILVKEMLFKMNKILVEVVAPMLSCVEMNNSGSELIFACLGLQDRDRNSCTEAYPEDWKKAVAYVTKWIDELRRLYRHRIFIRVIDAQSPLGFWKQLRHRLFRFPAFIVDKKLTYIGWDYSELESLIDRRIRGNG